MVMSRHGEGLGSVAVRLPGPGDDATAFVVRCYVQRAPFRPLVELEPDRRPLFQEFKLYVWRSATLRDIATLLYARDRSLSSPLTLHAFRTVHYDAKRGQCVAREAGSGVTRLSSSSFQAALANVHDEQFDAVTGPSVAKVVDKCRPTFPREADEDAASRTLDTLGWQDGDILDCVMKEPSSIRHGGPVDRIYRRKAIDDGPPPSAMSHREHPWGSGRTTTHHRDRDARQTLRQSRRDERRDERDAFGSGDRRMQDGSVGNERMRSSSARRSMSPPART